MLMYKSLEILRLQCHLDDTVIDVIVGLEDVRNALQSYDNGVIEIFLRPRCISRINKYLNQFGNFNSNH